MSSDRRAPLTLSPSGIAGAHERLAAAGRHAFLLSTCLRVEIAWPGKPEDADDVLAQVYGNGVDASGRVIRQDEEAFRHLCRIAAGLDTPLTGEVEVLGQFRKAASAFYDSGGPRTGLGKILELAVGVGRAARRLLPDQPAGSLATVAADQAAAFDRVAILGSGAMARFAAERLDTEKVTVFARRPGAVGIHEAQPWEDAIGALATYPAVISTIPGKTPFHSAEAMYTAMESRGQPLTLIDLGMPPGFSRVPADGQVNLIGVDEIASAVDPVPATAAEECVARGAESSWLRLAASERAGSVIAAIVDSADRAVDEEVRRFALRLPANGDTEAVLRQLAHTVARRVLHSPISYIGSTERGSEPVELLADAFGVDRD